MPQSFAQDFHALRTNVTQAFGVSADGSVVVVAIILERPYRWTATTGIVYLGARSHGDSTAALRVNAEGSVIVGFDVSGTGCRISPIPSTLRTDRTRCRRRG
jgi:hypothetical protein